MAAALVRLVAPGATRSTFALGSTVTATSPVVGLECDLARGGVDFRHHAEGAADGWFLRETGRQQPETPAEAT